MVDLAHDSALRQIDILKAENAKLRAALETILRCTHHDDVLEAAREALGRNEE